MPRNVVTHKDGANTCIVCSARYHCAGVSGRIVPACALSLPSRPGTPGRPPSAAPACMRCIHRRNRRFAHGLRLADGLGFALYFRIDLCAEQNGEDRDIRPEKENDEPISGLNPVNALPCARSGKARIVPNTISRKTPPKHVKRSASDCRCQKAASSPHKSGSVHRSGGVSPASRSTTRA